MYKSVQSRKNREIRDNNNTIIMQVLPSQHRGITIAKSKDYKEV